MTELEMFAKLPQLNEDYEISDIDYPDRYIKYRGHRYYIWYIHSGIGVAHDPDCPCYKNKQH